ncbi:MAG: c-type cytochrome [Chloroflexi bacterium]|nr:c-type cytochrome [Chloroflexota bacterium]
MFGQKRVFRAGLATAFLLLSLALVAILVAHKPAPSLAQDGTPESTPEGEDSGGNGGVPDPNSEDIVERGAYLVRVAGACQDCHFGGGDYNVLYTDSLTIELSGGNPFAYEPFGTVYAPNLTTLGGWTDEEIENAIRYGVRPDGSTLLPPMPYELYADMSDDDMAAMIAYLRSLEPVDSVVPEPELDEGTTREDVRTVPEFDLTAEFPAPDFTDPLTRGTYLASHVSACLRCHGSLAEDGVSIDPIGPANGEITQYTQYGDMTFPELVQSRMGDWTDEEIKAVLHDGIKPNGEPIFFMPFYAFANLTDGDVAALITWIRSQP